jgi:putative Mn2+ efflux pump MntP
LRSIRIVAALVLAALALCLFGYAIGRHFYDRISLLRIDPVTGMVFMLLSLILMLLILKPNKNS